MSETVNVVIAGTPTPIVLFDGNSLEAARQAAIATAAANAATATLSAITPMEVGGGKNKFDPLAVTPNLEVNGIGVVSTQTQSSISGLIFVAGREAITTSGLQPSPAFLPIGRFLKADGTTLVGPVVRPAAGGVATSFKVPNGAVWFQFSPKQRNPDAANYATVQVEYGYEATAYEAYRDPEIVVLGNKPISNAAYKITTRGKRDLFIPGAFISGFEVHNSGSILVEADSVITQPIKIPDSANGVFVSGLQTNPSERRYRWQTSNGTGLGQGFLAEGINSGDAAFIPKPSSNDAHLIVTLRQRNAVANSFGNVQIEIGGFPTPKQAYTPVVSAIDGIDVGYKDPRWAGLNYLFFGDSITETSNVDAGNNDWNQSSSGTPYRSNWPTVFVPEMWAASAFNYAKSGAAFNNSGAGNLRLENQISEAITDSRNPDVNIVAIGTNDLGGSFGSYALAMAKPLGALDRSVTMEAARYNFYNICNQWPKAVNFYMTPLQRKGISADTLPPDTMKPFVDEMVLMARRYGFTLIDAFNESGIVYDFEVTGGVGDDLYDGLHPGASGWIKHGKLAAARVKARIG